MSSSRTFLPTHPILFLMDYSNREAEVPALDEAAICSHTDTCVSVRTIADVDGDVTVTLSNVPPSSGDGLAEVFRGRIRVPNANVAIVTSENERLLESPTTSENVELRVFVDDRDYPSRVWVTAS